jgi:hypothetical protein
MRRLEFQVCRYGSEGAWIVRLGDEVYGSYLSREQALLDAVDAAGDAQQGGDDAQVRDEAAVRVF